MRIFWQIPIKALPDFIFTGFYTKIMFWVRWFYNLFERMRLEWKNDVFSIVSADPQFSAQRAREGVNRSGAWGLSLRYTSVLKFYSQAPGPSRGPPARFTKCGVEVRFDQSEDFTNVSGRTRIEWSFFTIWVCEILSLTFFES